MQETVAISDVSRSPRLEKKKNGLFSSHLALSVHLFGTKFL